MFKLFTRLLLELRAILSMGTRIDPPAYPPIVERDRDSVPPVMDAPFAPHDNTELDGLRALLNERRRERELATEWTQAPVDDGRSVQCKGGNA